MPVYQVTQDSTGITLELEGERPPTQEEVEGVFKQYASMNKPQKGFFDRLTESVMGVAPEPVELTQAPAAPIKRPEGFEEDTLTTRPTFQERMQRPEIKSKIFPALAALEQQVTEDLTRQFVTKPAGSRLEREGVMAPFAASPEKREVFKEAFQSVGRAIGPKTEAAAGVVGEAAADLLTAPGSILTAGIATGLRGVATIPETLRAVEGGVTASELQSAARTARTAQALERGAVLGFAEPTIESAVVSTREAAGILDSNAPVEDKVRASTQAGLSLLFTGLLGAGAKESFRQRTGLLNDAAAMEQLAGRQISARDAAANLKRVREEIAFAEATLPERGTETISPEQMRADAEVRARLAETRALMDQALNEAVQARVIDTGELTAIERLRAQGTEVIAPERIGEGPRAGQREPMLPRRIEGEAPFIEAITPEVPIEAQPQSQLRAAAEIAAERRRPEPVMLETVAEKAAKRIEALGKAVEQRDQATMAEAITAALEEGAAQGEPVVVTRKMIEAELGIGKPKKPATKVAETIIGRETEQAKVDEFNRIFDDVIKRLMAEEEARVSQQREQSRAAQSQEAAKAQPLKLFVDGIEGQSVPFNQIPGGNAAFEYAVGIVEPGGTPGVYRRSVSEKGTYGGWRWESDPSKVSSTPIQTQPPQGRFSQAAEGLTQALENLRVDVDPGLGANPIPQLLGTSWNGALVVAQSMIKGGAKLADAIEKAVRYVQYDFKGKFDEAALRRDLEAALAPMVSTGAPERTAAPTPGSQLRIATQQGMRPRRVAERIVASENVPLEVRQAVAQSPGASYERQNVKELRESISKQTEDQLLADIVNPESNTRVASSAKLLDNMFKDGRTQQGIDFGLSLAKTGTTLGQLINQFKLLNAASPEGLAILVAKSAEKSGRKVSPELIEKVKTQMADLNKAKDGVDVIESALRDAVEADAPQSALNILYQQRGEKVAELNKSNVALNSAIAKANPASITDMFIASVQGGVMAPLAFIRNTLYNAAALPYREAADVSAAGIDALVTGGKNNTYDINARTIERIKSLWDSVPQAMKVVLKGSDAIPYEVGKDVGNPLNFQRAWKNIFAAVKQGDFRNVLRDGYEATFGIYPDIMLRMATATDIPFKQAQRASVIAELGRQSGLTDKQIQLAQKNIDLVKITDEQAKAGKKGLTKEQIENIEFEAARAVYQQDNAATLAIGNANRWIKQKAGPGGYIPYRLITLFQKTPINVLGEIISFTPFAGSLRFAKEMTPRERNILISKQIIGAAVIYAWDHLYDKGLITANLDTPQDTEKARQLALSSGAQPPGTFNITGSKRYASGGDPKFKPGDTVIDLSTLGIGGALGIMVGTARRLKEMGRQDESDLMAMAWGGVLGQLNFIMNQAMMKGTSEFIGLLNGDQRNSFQNFAKGMLVTAGSPFAPSILKSIDMANREFMPVIKDENFIESARNELNRRLNVIGVQIPGAPVADKLPLKRDLWGEAVPQTPPGENPWIYNLLDPIRARSIPADPLNADIYRLWRKTADAKAVPSIPSPKIEYLGVEYDKMTPDQYDRYTQLVGFFRRTLAEKVYMSGAFSNADSDQRIDMLSTAYSKGARMGKHTFMQELKAKGESLKPLAPRRGFQPTE